MNEQRGHIGGSPEIELTKLPDGSIVAKDEWQKRIIANCRIAGEMRLTGKDQGGNRYRLHLAINGDFYAEELS